MVPSAASEKSPVTPLEIDPETLKNEIIPKYNLH
jgi:hypothetical protein